MGRQLEQLPPDMSSLARQIAQLRRELRELRAAKRAGHTAISTGGLILNDSNGDMVAEVATDWNERGVSAVAVYDTRLGDEYYAALAAGDLCFGVAGITDEADEGRIGFARIDETMYELLISSGSRPGRAPAAINMYSETGVAVGDSRLDVTAGSMSVSGTLKAGNCAWGTVTITPNAAGVPTAMAVSGFSLTGTSFTAQATPTTSVPGTTVAGVGITNASATGVTVWLTRGNTAATDVNWMVIGQ
ncbi:hypothetical protein [Streptomyces sp. OR43]|uniref:hypothetical protein n=1 Tax=Streptomyces sp. or43 TaxID=2478957 RepID=UPI0011CDBA93|nr:hypothetical protein [Streptomyces sp. or43]TXS35709.1 hypothetical protein EAO72_19005 [Streptomyces sp. or43]